MDFGPSPNRYNFKDKKKYEIGLKEWDKEFKRLSKKYIIED